MLFFIKTVNFLESANSASSFPLQKKQSSHPSNQKNPRIKNHHILSLQKQDRLLSPEAQPGTYRNQKGK